jgi:prepilin-type N-terminal cleavage/methylation domain-containing protein
MSRRIHVSNTSQAGFTLVEMMMTVAVFAILAGAAVPQLADMNGAMRLRQAAREVERELQTARLRAVTANRPIRVRFNCPSAGQYRMVELIGTPGDPDGEDLDTDLSRCSDYPYPAADQNRLTLPNHDGPVRELHPTIEFSSGASKTLEFWPDGSAHQWTTAATEAPWDVVTTSGTAVTLVKTGTTQTASITVNGLGKVQIAQ